MNQEPTLQDFMPGGADGVGRAGGPLPSGATVAAKDAIVDAIREVYDPEISVNLYDLGLIYDMVVEADGDVRIRMTLTSPMCPVAGILPQQEADAAALQVQKRNRKPVREKPPDAHACGGARTLRYCSISKRGSLH